MSQGVLDSKLFISFIDKRYCESNSTINEFYFALFNKKPIIPIMCEDLKEIVDATTNNPIAFNIPHRLYEKFEENDDFSKRLQERIKSMLRPENLQM